MRHGSLFSGIGGFDLAAEWMGWENVFHCEWNKFGQKVLHYYWPNAICYENICTTDFRVHRGEIDILTGGFPCQPYSSAGKRLGKEDDRHLWPEMLRAIQEIQPRWIVGENVRGLTNWNGGVVFDEVQSDLETQGYEVTPFLLPACAVNAPHRRDRIWFVAYAKCNRLENISKSTHLSKQKRETYKKRNNSTNVFAPNSSKLYEKWSANKEAKYIICGGYNGISKRLDFIAFRNWRKESIKSYGNAVVPQVVLQIFKTIEQYERTKNTDKD